MGKLRMTIVLFLMSCVFVGNAQTINYDQKTLEALLANIAADKLINEECLRVNDTIKQRQSRLAELVDIIAANKELWSMTYKNIKGFKEESKYYKAIVNIGADIVRHSGQAYDALQSSKLPGKIMAESKIALLVTDAVSLGKAFADIVANGTVALPIKHPNDDGKVDNSKRGDSHNYLNRRERLKMANDIFSRLKHIDRLLRQVIYYSKASTYLDVLKRIDRKGYLKAVQLKRESHNIADKWNKLTK